MLTPELQRFYEVNLVCPATQQPLRIQGERMLTDLGDLRRRACGLIQFAAMAAPPLLAALAKAITRFAELRLAARLAPGLLSP